MRVSILVQIIANDGTARPCRGGRRVRVAVSAVEPLE